MLSYGRSFGRGFHTADIRTFDEALKLAREALEKAEAQRKAREESFRKAVEKIAGTVPTHFILDEAGQLNEVVIIHGGGSSDLLPDGTRIVTRWSTRKPKKKKSKSGSDHEPYYVKLTQKKRR